MKYNQIDRITSLVPGESITAERTLRAGEEYLADHFPRFPVMPGVMMLEALHQAARWLVRVTDDFAHPLVHLDGVRSVKFGDFLAPDETLVVNASIVGVTGGVYKLKASATKDGKSTVSARLVMRPATTGDPDRLGNDAEVIRAVREQFAKLYGAAVEGQGHDPDRVRENRLG